MRIEDSGTLNYSKYKSDNYQRKLNELTLTDKVEKEKQQLLCCKLRVMKKLGEPWWSLESKKKVAK